MATKKKYSKPIITGKSIHTLYLSADKRGTSADKRGKAHKHHPPHNNQLPFILPYSFEEI